MPPDTTVNPVEDLIARLQHRLRVDQTQPTFLMDQPGTHTVRIAGKGYRKKPMPGGDYLALADCYIGMSGKMIFIFNVVADHYEFNRVEMDRERAEECLEGFTTYYNKVLNEDFDDAVEEINKTKPGSSGETVGELVKNKYGEESGFGTW